MLNMQSPDMCNISSTRTYFFFFKYILISWFDFLNSIQLQFNQLSYNMEVQSSVCRL